MLSVQGIRSYLLLRHVPVPRYNLTDGLEGAESALTQQDRQVLKHLEAMLPTWRQLIAGAPDAWHARLSTLVSRPFVCVASNRVPRLSAVCRPGVGPMNAAITTDMFFWVKILV